MTALKGESSDKIGTGNLGCFETGAVIVFETVDFVDFGRPGPRLLTVQEQELLKPHYFFSVETKSLAKKAQKNLQ